VPVECTRTPTIRAAYRVLFQGEISEAKCVTEEGKVGDGELDTTLATQSATSMSIGNITSLLLSSTCGLFNVTDIVTLV
jgi:hypothetical protein